MDVDRFSKFFNDAPVVSVPGRLYPIELPMATSTGDDDPDLPSQIANACDELIAEALVISWFFFPVNMTSAMQPKHCGAVA